MVSSLRHHRLVIVAAAAVVVELNTLLVFHSYRFPARAPVCLMPPMVVTLIASLCHAASHGVGVC